MTELERLIQDFCPNGVAFMPLNALCKVQSKGAITKNDLLDSGYPVINSSRDVLGYYSEFNNEPDTLVLTSHGAYAGFSHYLCERFYAGALCYPMKTSDETVIGTKYLYYVFKSLEATIREKYVNKSGVPYINFKSLMNHRIAVPPIVVQYEIVKILDNFTEVVSKLTAELTAELAARKKQYTAYLNILINEDCFENTTPMKLGQLFEFRNGLSKGKEFFGRGTPFIRYTDVYNNRALRKENISALVECSESELKNLSVKRGDVLFTRTSETAEDIGWSSVMLDDIGDCVFNGFTIRATPKTDFLLPEYCAYCFSTDRFRKFVASKCAFTTRASLTGKTIAEYELAIPSLEEQRRIVSLLDRLYSLCHNLEEDLPVEIESRQKQYEYHRDKLLTFKELSV